MNEYARFTISFGSSDPIKRTPPLPRLLEINLPWAILMFSCHVGADMESVTLTISDISMARVVPSPHIIAIP